MIPLLDSFPPTGLCGAYYGVARPPAVRPATGYEEKQRRAVSVSAVRYQLATPRTVNGTGKIGIELLGQKATDQSSKSTARSDKLNGMSAAGERQSAYRPTGCQPYW